MVVTVSMVFWTVSDQVTKVRLISEISVFSYLALGQIRKLGNLGKIFLSFKTELNFDLIWFAMVATVFMLFLTVSEKKSKARLISEISEFSFLALGQIWNLGNLGKSFSSSGMIWILCLTMTRNGSNCFHAFLDCFRAKE